jgi:hypothetical protein
MNKVPSSKYLVKNSLKKQDKHWDYMGINNQICGKSGN